MMNESIFPFVCFEWGWDFNPTCSILDRVVTIAEFGELNKTNLFNTQRTNRGSFYFGQSPLTQHEMEVIMFDIAKRSILYYFSKYGEEIFKTN
jgi:type II restriction enzyme